MVSNSKEYSKRYREEHKDKLREWAKKNYVNNRESILANKKRYRDERSSEQIRKQLDAQIKSKRKLKFELLLHYSKVFDSNAVVPCCCDPFHLHLFNCPFLTELDSLSIDHINGGGTEERKKTGSGLYAQLKKRGFPEGYQVLCMNCQYVKRVRNNEVPRHL